MENDNFYSGFKYNRVLQIYTKLMKGEIINKAELAKYFGVGEKSIQRDIEDLRAFFENQTAEGRGRNILVYSRELKGYYLDSEKTDGLSKSEILAICKILLESRAFRKDEILPLIEKIIGSCNDKNEQKILNDLIANELIHYTELKHKKAIINSMWDLNLAIKECKKINIAYCKQNGELVERKIKPVGLMFSEFYFYITGFIDGTDKEKYENKEDIYSTIYRVDRIRKFEILNEHFEVPYKDRFEEGEFRKRIQFMYGGKLRRIKFKYTGDCVEAVLDRLPTEEIIKKEEGGYIISAEVFGNGVDMWLRSQGDLVRVM